MGLLNPLFLIGALASLVPLLIHLWSRRQATTVEFSSLRFLLEAHRKSVRKLQIRQWLILLLRMLLVALIAIAFARPLLKSELSLAGARIRTSCVIVLDNSYSMGYEDLTGNRFEQAKKEALAVAKTLQRGDRASLVLMSDKAEVVFPRLTTDLAQVAQAIRGATVSERGTSLRAGMEAAYQLLEGSEDPNQEIYLITDLTRNAWENWNADVMRSGVRVFLIPVGEPDAPNATVEEIRWPNPLIGVGLPIPLEIRLRSEDSVRREGVLSLVIDGQKRREIGLSLEPGTTTTQTITYRFDAPGDYLGYVSLQEDRLPPDDRYYFAVRVLGDQRVLCVEEGAPYLSLAVQPEPPETPNQPSLFLPTVIPYQALEETALEKYALVAVSDLLRVSPAGLRRLANYLQNGGRVLAFLGRNDAITPDALRPLLPGTIQPAVPFETPRSWHLRVPDSPIFIPTPAESFTAATGPRFYRAYPIQLDPSAAAFQVLASFGPEEAPPAILMDDSRRLLVFNTALDPREWTSLPLHPTFVPLVQQGLLYLIGQTTFPQQWRVGASESVAIPQAEGSRVQIQRVGDSQARSVVLRPDRTTEPVAVEHAGFYVLEYRRRGARHQRHFAANVDRRESRLETYTPEEALARLKGAHLVTDPERLQEQLNDYRSGREVWGHLLLLSLALMMLELYLANTRKSRT